MATGDYTRLGTNNMVLPPEGPKVFPNVLDFRQSGEATLDFLHTIQQNFVSFIQGFFVDNSKNANPLVIRCEQTNHTVTIPAGMQGYMPMFISDSAVLYFSTTPANNLTVPVIVTNVPVTPYLWKVD